MKVVQLEELLQIRHCVFVMGPPGAGKSQSWKVRYCTVRRIGEPGPIDIGIYIYICEWVQ